MTNIPIEMELQLSTKKMISEYRNSDFQISGFAISSRKNIHKAYQNDDALYGEGGEEDEDELEPLENLDEEDE